ncbi:MAG: hypothetical protein K9G28_01485, partial [Candidatus Nanopelagicales bacterium]|nr:hypothetical protein [Candidatus Nanopelagicales bacterium]
PVYRRYVDMGQFLELLVGLASPGERTLLDSGGERAEIGELARLIAVHSGVDVTRAVDEHASRDDYCPDPTAFEAAARHLGVKLLPLRTQVDRTIAGHQAQLPGGPR